MNKAKVLVVEDNVITRKMMRVALETAGYDVLEAPDGRTAVRLAQTKNPALIVQDLLLPDIDGVDLVRELRRSMGVDSIPILACTGLMSRLDEARTIQGGFTDYLFKPIEPSRLIETIERYLAAPAPEAKSSDEQIKVLLVDDDAVELKLERLVLEREGFIVTTARDGQEAWETAHWLNPDAVLCDLIMPNMNGFDLCVALRKHTKFSALPIVITSSTASNIDEEDRRLAEKVGADAFVARTPDLKPAVKALRGALGKKSHPQPTSDAGALKETYVQRLVSRLEQQTSRNGELIRRASEEKAQLAVVASITDTLNRKLSLQAALDEALARILDAAGISVGAVYLAEPDGGLILKSQIGFGPAKSEELQDFFGHAALLHRALGARKAIKMPSAEIAAETADDLRRKIEAESLLIAPLVVGDDSQGVLVAFTSRAGLEDAWIDSVKTVTVHLAQAVLLARTMARVSESEQRFRELAENIHGIFYVAGSSGAPLQYVSPAWEEITGRSCEELYHNAAIRFDNLHPDDRARVEQSLQGGAEDLDIEYRILRPDGEMRWLHDRSFPVKDESGRTIRIVGIAEDVTARKRAEQTAQQNLARIRALHEIDLAITSTLDLNTILEILLDKVGVFLPIAAASTVRLLDLDTLELESLACRGLDEKAWKSQTRATLEENREQRVVETRAPVILRDIERDARLYSPEVFRGLVSYLGVPLVAHEKVLGILGLYTNRRHEFSGEEIDFLDTLAGQAAIAIHNAQLYEKMARANRVKDQFLSVMSHELRTPLSVVMGYTGLVKEGTLGEINPRQEAALQKVLVRAGDQLEMIDEIMQTTQLEARAIHTHNEPFNLRDLLDQFKSDYTIREVAKEVRLTWDYPSMPTPVVSDRVKLKQILSNLVNNALKFTERGKIEVAARVVGRGGGQESDRIEFKVSDTGIGIAKEMQLTIFKKFHQADGSETRSYGGVGLGLFIVKQFTELLGGEIELESAPGEGSVFTVRIPCERGPHSGIVYTV